MGDRSAKKPEDDSGITQRLAKAKAYAILGRRNQEKDRIQLEPLK